MPDASDPTARQIADDFINGVKAAHDMVDRWIDVAFSAEFRSIQSDGEDVRQEVRLRLYRNLTRGCFDGRSSLRTYVHRIARNVAIDFTRRAYRRRETGAMEGLPPRLAIHLGSSADSVDSRDFLEKVLEPFDSEERLMIALVFEARCTSEEVAARLGIPAGTVRSRVSRLRRKILQRRRILTSRGPDAG